jgi:phosphatidylglycerol:prolipoprotein diacylglycerol transferase
MLPNLEVPPLKIYGPLELHLFGLLVAAAIFLGYTLGGRRATRMGLDRRTCEGGMLWAVVVGFAMAHWVSAVLYFPEKIAADPLYLVRFWDGISSFGGFLGGLLGSWWYFRKKGVPFMPYAEAIFFGLVPAWVVGRLACTFAFDHPGLPTDFFLGMADKQGVVRHNLGLYEMLATLVFTGVLYALRDRRPFPGFHLALIMALYAPVRFMWDSLRVADKTYLGLTPGQYLAIAMGLGALGWLAWGLTRKRSAAGATAPTP